jgi:hypothetical protein
MSLKESYRSQCRLVTTSIAMIEATEKAQQIA